MEQIKRRNSNADDNTKKKLLVEPNSLKTSITHFEDLSNEIIYEMFDFFDFCEVYEAFSYINRRFQNLFTHSTLPIKIKLLSASKSTFQRYHTQIIMPNQHRIRSLHLSNPFIIEGIFPPVPITLELTQLETLIINKIESTYLEYLLKYLLVVPYLSSLIIDSEDNVENKSNLYTQVFRLPALKYCNLSFKEISRSELLPVAMKEFNLNNLLSYVPHLKRLSIHSEYKYRIEQMQLYSSTLIHLTHVSLNSPDIPFDQFESIVQSFFNHIQVLHISNGYSKDYLDADRWQRLIVSHMPQLQTFDIHIECILYGCEDSVDYITQIRKFNSPFWSKRQWLFEFHIYEMENGHRLISFSTNPYRRKLYRIYAKKDKDIDINSRKTIMKSVHQIETWSDKAIINCRNYFPNVTELSIFFSSSGESTNLHSTSLNNIIPLNQLTKFILRFYYDDFSKIIELLQYTPNIHTFEINDILINNSDLVSIEQSEVFRLVSKTNNIRNMVIRRHSALNISKFLTNLCPRLHELSIEKFNDDFQSFLQFLLSNNNGRINYLFLLRITWVLNDEMEIMKTFINVEELLNQYSLQIKYNKFNRNMYLWW